MKYFSIFILISLFTFIACMPKCEKEHINTNTIQLDSVVIAISKRGFTPSDAKKSTHQYQFIKGNGGSFYILYDNDEENLKRVGKYYMVLYQIFPKGVPSIFFDETTESVDSIDLVEEFPVLVEGKKYMIEKYVNKEAYVSNPSQTDQEDVLCIHYFSKDLGLIAISNHHFHFVVEKNSAFNDIIMKEVSERVTEKIRAANR